MPSRCFRYSVQAFVAAGLLSAIGSTATAQVPGDPPAGTPVPSSPPALSEQRALGQVTLATFPNQEGLVAEGSNLFRVGPATGDPTVTTPGLAGSGPVLGGALELSNVDLGQEFIKMIMTSTGYSASSRVIRTTDELMQQLLVLGR